MSLPSMLVEACVTTVAEAVAAAAAGADRLELCSVLAVGGVTPSAGLLRRTLAAVRVPVAVLVRPRPGSFSLTEADWHTTLADIDFAFAAGAAAVVVGDITPAGRLRPERLAEWRRLAAGRELVFHRAFDRLADPLEGLRILGEEGFDRVLTSGGTEGGAAENAEQLAEYVEWAAVTAGCPAILAGGGVTSGNVASLVRRSGVGQVHGSFTGGRDAPPESPDLAFDAEELAAVRRELAGLSA